ncbi:CAZyme family GH5 [Penicillium capsulatum]|uniref:CAZyme family GH5 n=1 Tax=Penicillium capsulatum TaxID=69766 RepID=A0A9W9INC4_9EURO|nr:CAZyme family GH5 [Penicillium capsulatum]KAJ6121263.1 CAZyme family GH5 [Penicillium capsulatum]
MVCIGDEGFGLDTGSDGSYPYSYGEGLNFTRNLEIDSIDFGTFHLYPSSRGTSTDWGNGWATSHGESCAAVDKPCLFEEYGDTSRAGKSPDDGNTFYSGTDEFFLSGDGTCGRHQRMITIKPCEMDDASGNPGSLRPLQG